VIGLEELREMPLQYPFEVFRLTGTPMELKTFVRYVYLEAGLVETIFLDKDITAAVTVLLDGLDKI
jgi:hypothetical protein